MNSNNITALFLLDFSTHTKKCTVHLNFLLEVFVLIFYSHKFKLYALCTSAGLMPKAFPSSRPWGGLEILQAGAEGYIISVITTYIDLKIQISVRKHLLMILSEAKFFLNSLSQFIARNKPLHRHATWFDLRLLASLTPPGM